MDGAWLARAGILAELVSVFLIAPQIIGLRRLRHLERTLERWLKDSSQSLELYWRGVLEGGQSEIEVGSIRRIVLSIVPWAGLCLLSLIWIPFAFAGLAFLIIIVAHAWVVLCAWVTQWPCLQKPVENNGAASFFLLLPLGVALVFGTGIVLLFGGMAAQFVATF